MAVSSPNRHVIPAAIASGGTCRLGSLPPRCKWLFFFQFHSKVVLFDNSHVKVVLFANFTCKWFFLTITHGGGPFCQKFACGYMYSTIYLVRANQSNVWLIRASQVA
jgi:hypothetical protein